jgi:DNA-binding CsgD family transcriptional regulator
LADNRRLQRQRIPSEIPDELRGALADALRRLSPNIPEALAEISLPVYIVDRKGTTRWLNAAALDLFGDRRGEHFSAVVAPEAQPFANEQFARKMVGGVRRTAYDLMLIARDGRRFDAEIESVKLEHDTEVVGVFGIVDVERFASSDAPEIRLTPRQLQVLKLLAAGCSTDGIAKALHVSRQTVRNHVRDLLRALGVHSRVQAILRAQELGIV